MKDNFAILTIFNKRPCCLFRPALLFFLLFFVVLLAGEASAQPLPPINPYVVSRTADNRLTWTHHPMNTPGYVKNYQIWRKTTTGTWAHIATTSYTTAFNDNTAGYSYETEFFYHICAVGDDALVSQPSDEVMRFLPRVGLTGINMQTGTISNLHYVSWDPYPGELSDVYVRIGSTPDGGAINNYFSQYRHYTRTTRPVELAPGGPYYFSIIIYRPNWWVSPANYIAVSYSSSLPFFVNPEADYEDNASSTYFNSSQNRVMATPSVTGGVKAQNLSNPGPNGFWRIRRPIRMRGQVEYIRNPTIYIGKLNAPCRAVISGIPAGEITAGRAAAEVRVADEYGNELVSKVMEETNDGTWVTSFAVHFITSQDYNVYENYWVHWGNDKALPPNYGTSSFKNNTKKTAQFDYTPWYSRVIYRGGLEAYQTTSAYQLLPASLPTDEDFITIEPLKHGATTYSFPYFDLATTAISVSTNGYLSFLPHSDPVNSWPKFTGASDDCFIAPYWGNLMINDTQPTNAGLYYRNYDSATTRRHHAQFTWLANRFNAVNEAYIFQASLYRMGDITLRYETLNFNGLFQAHSPLPLGPGDYPLNVAPHHTAGISRNDGNRWLSITDNSEQPSSENSQVCPLKPDTGRNVIHYFQSCHSWEFENINDPTNIVSMAGSTSVAHYDSRIFDGRSTDPTWTSVSFDIGGSGSIDFYIRTSASTTFPDWDASHLLVTSASAPGATIPLTIPADRYLQYRAVFKKSAPSDNPHLQRVKFDVGYIMIDNTTNQFNNADVSQGQTILASMTWNNFFSGTLDTKTASLTFTAAADQTWTAIASLPTAIAAEAAATIAFSITVDENSGNLNNWTVVDGYVEAGNGIATLTSSAAINTSQYRIRPKASLQIDWVDTAFDKVNKGQGGIPVSMQVSNLSPYVPMILNTAALTFSLGQYIVTPAISFAPGAQGLLGEYFNTSTAYPPPFPTQSSFQRVDTTVDFNWGAASPVPGVIEANYFAIRWTGYVVPPATDTYTFYVWSDDGTRLWINGKLIIDNWVTGGSERVSVPVTLTGDVPAQIVLETFERTGNARAELRWESSTILKSIIPDTQLIPVLIPVIHGDASYILGFNVAVHPDSPSGVAYIGANASATNAWVPGLITDSASPLVIDSWIVQSPASLTIGEISGPELVYRGQSNIPVEVEIINVGEADAEIASIPLFFTLGSYTDIIAGEPMPVTLTGGESRLIKVLVSLLEGTPTGTAWIDADVTGNDSNTGVALNASGAAEPWQWQILAEKILTYKDPSHLYPSAAFVRPEGSFTGIYALAENLAPLKEYGIRWYDIHGNEIIASTSIGFSDPDGKLTAEWQAYPAMDYGVYTVKITNPVNTYSPSQTSFRIVTSASVSAELILPEKVSVGQAFNGFLEITNSGGADATGMVPTPLLMSGAGTANLVSGPAPASLEVLSGSTATAAYAFTALTPGDFIINAGANGFDASSNAQISASQIDSAPCLIQTPAAVTIIGLVATPTLVYRGQRDIEVLMTLANSGEADAIIDLADLRRPVDNNLNICTALLASPSIPAILAGNSVATWTFRVNINTTAATGLATITARISYADTNNPVPAMIFNTHTHTFNIEASTITLYANPTYTTVRWSFRAGDTVYARGSALPLDTNVRIRFYESTEPYPPTGIGVGVLTPLNTGLDGIVSHPGHTLPDDTTMLNQWMAIVDDGDDTTVGNILAIQFFDVFGIGTFSLSLDMDRPTCFVGEQIDALLTVNNLATWPTNLRSNLYRFNHTYTPESVGAMTRLSPVNITLPFLSNSSYTFAVSMNADSDSGLAGSSTIRLPGSSWRALDDAAGGGTIWYTSITDAQNPIRIFRKNLRLLHLPLAAQAPGLRGEYYNTLVAPAPVPIGGPVVTRVDSAIDFNWGGGSPAPGVNANLFAVRWTGYVTASTTDVYTFYASTDDGVRLWVNGDLLIDRWSNGSTELNGNIALTAGVPIPIEMEYYESTSNARAELRWSSLAISKQFVPAANLSHLPYPPAVWDFGLVEPGESSANVSSFLYNTGNHNLENVNLARVDLRKSVTETISGLNLNVDPAMPLAVPTSSFLNLESSIQIPFHQAPGVYVATMAIYEDHNFSSTLEVTETSKEPHNLVMTRIEVAAVAKAMITTDLIDLGIIAAGETSAEEQIEYVGIGNLNLTDLQFDSLAASGITIVPLTIGAFPYDGYGTASISVSVPPATPPGEYAATGTLRNNIAGGAFDEFSIRWMVGTQSLIIAPDFFTLGYGTPTFEIPNYPASVQNTGELPLSKLRGYSSDFTNIDQPCLVASDNISLSSPAFIATSTSEPVSALVYVPGGTATGTYTANFTWYEDTNKDKNRQAFEAYDQAVASFVVQSYYKIYALKSTEDFGAAKPGNMKTISVGFRNAGSLPMPKVRYVITSLSDGTNSFSDAYISAVPQPSVDVIPGELRFFSLSADVPATQTHAIYWGELAIYADLDDDESPTLGEPIATATLRIEIGDQEIDITSPAGVFLSGGAASASTAVFVTAKNTGTLAMSKVRVAGTDLVSIPPGTTIASSAFVFSPSASLGSMIPSQSRTFSARVNIPFAQSSGFYEGFIWAWEDANLDGIHQPGETAASVPVQLNVTFFKRIQTNPNSINLGLAAPGDIASASFLVQNIGNTSLDDVRWHKNFMPPSPINPTDISITADPIGLMATPPVGFPMNEIATISITIPTVGAIGGVHTGLMFVFDDDYDPAIDVYNPGLEPAATLSVTINIAFPFFTLDPNPIIIPATDPVGWTATTSFSLTNSGGIAFKRPSARVSNLVGPATIASSQIMLNPTVFNPLTVGQSQNASVAVLLLPASLPPGIYVSNLTIWDDRNFDGIQNGWESFSITEIRVTVNPRAALNIIPNSVSIGNVARNQSSPPFSISFQNTGNINLSGHSWIKQDMEMSPGVIIPHAKINFVSDDPVVPGQFATATVTIGPIDVAQDLGFYGPTTMRLTDFGTASDSVQISCTVIAGGPQSLEPGTIWQEIATKTFPLSPAEDYYILSAYVCQATGTARVSFLTTDEAGLNAGEATLDIDTNGNVTSSGLAVNAGFTQALQNEQGKWYRVYVRFRYGYDHLIASKTYIILSNSSPVGQGHSVLFDGVLLEKASADQLRPTTWSQGPTIYSPGRNSDLSGQHRYYQW